MKTINDSRFDVAHTFNPDTPDNSTDGQSVATLNGDDCPMVFNRCTFDGAYIHWGCKVTAFTGSDNIPVVCTDITFNDCTFIDGVSRAYDQVRGGRITFNRCRFISTGRRKRVTSAYFDLSEICDCGLKGGVFDVTFNDCSINDLLLGDWTIYDQIKRPKTRRITLTNCVNPNGGKIIIRGRYCDGNTIVLNNTPASTFVWPSFITWLYWQYNKRFGDHRTGIAGEFTITPIETI
jgi:hypothetical protein